MQPILNDMIENKVKTAQYKLSQHKVQGAKSSLSIFEVASLMDLVKMGENNTSAHSSHQFLLN